METFMNSQKLRPADEPETAISGHFRDIAGETLTLADLTLHPEEHAVVRGGKSIRLRKKEYQLLEFLARNKNKVLNRHTLLEYVWNYNIQAMTNTLEVHISNLRRKIDIGYPTKILQTVHGLGYKLCDSPNSAFGKTEHNEPATNLAGTSPPHQVGDLVWPQHRLPSFPPRYRE